MEPKFDDRVKDILGANKIIAVVVLDKADDAPRLADALTDGGVSAVELTLRTPAALDAIAAMKKHAPEVVVGAGTVLFPDQVKQVLDNGADFAVAPGLNPRILEEADKQNLPFAPGVATASEIEQAISFGLRVLKVFPVEPLGGLTYLKSVAGPYGYLEPTFIPLGGLRANNVGPYLASPLVAAVGGSWIAKRDAISAGDWTTITKNAKEATSIAAG
jgi:2-dehydro-3-deoxyphosphogluconate aldolase/(4S)-4-hydroxy-2-oxoglutarate aldolase